MFRRVAADPSPLLDDHTREIIAEAIAWAVTRAVGQLESHPSAAVAAEARPSTPIRMAAGR